MTTNNARLPTYRDDIIRGTVDHLVKLQDETRWNTIALLGTGSVLVGGCSTLRLGSVHGDWLFSLEIEDLSFGGSLPIFRRNPILQVEFYVRSFLHAR